MMAGVRKRFVRRFWAAHNDSPAIRREIQTRLEALGGGRGLHLGCGDVRLSPRLVNFDIARAPAVDVAGDALALPFPAGCFALVLSQEMVEHVADPFRAVREAARVLKPGGTLYLQAPFIIGYHPGPEDYWRFTRAGMRRLIEQAGLECVRVEQAVGGGRGMYRIAVEFFAGVTACVMPALYLPCKALASVILYPLTFFDGCFAGGRQSDRIPGGYFAIGVKKKTP
jgi:SAM-dependent methyltransferase